VRRSPGGDGPERAAAAPESTLAGERAFGPWRSTLAAEPRVPAGLRWRCQHFLLVNLHGGALDEGAVDPWRDPEACRQRPLACDDVDVVYCRTLEEALYATWGRDPPAYESRLRRAAYALRAGGRALAERHPPDALAHLDDDTLARSTEAGRRRLEARQRIEACRAMMSDMQIFDDAPAAVVRCRKCRSADVVSTALQIRSADEPMTVFNRCAGCGARWRS
jgi:DNA-directed RNA polymerase subunit M/transcription elongation factor TFIIS